MSSRRSWLFALAVVLFGAACGAPPAPSPAPASATGATTWHSLGTWSGRGDRQTESFEVTTGALRLTWETRAASTGVGTFRVALYSAISGRPLQTIVERQGAGSGTAYVEDDPRVSYLVIESQHVEWRATLDEAHAARPGR